MFLLGLGSNLSSSFGDRFENLDLATSYLEEYKIKIIIDNRKTFRNLKEAISQKLNISSDNFIMKRSS